MEAGASGQRKQHVQAEVLPFAFHETRYPRLSDAQAMCRIRLGPTLRLQVLFQAKVPPFSLRRPTHGTEIRMRQAGRPMDDPEGNA